MPYSTTDERFDATTTRRAAMCDHCEEPAIMVYHMRHDGSGAPYREQVCGLHAGRPRKAPGASVQKVGDLT